MRAKETKRFESICLLHIKKGEFFGIALSSQEVECYVEAHATMKSCLVNDVFKEYSNHAVIIGLKFY